MVYEHLFYASICVIVLLVLLFTYRYWKLRSNFWKAIDNEQQTSVKLYEDVIRLHNDNIELKEKNKEDVLEYFRAKKDLSNEQDKNQHLARTNEELHQQLSDANIKLADLTKKMKTAYCVHQVIFTKYGKKVLCLAEVIYADSMGQAFAKFVIKRNKRLRDNKIIGAKCGHIQVHRVWKDVK